LSKYGSDRPLCGALPPLTALHGSQGRAFSRGVLTTTRARYTRVVHNAFVCGLPAPLVHRRPHMAQPRVVSRRSTWHGASASAAEGWPRSSPYRAGAAPSHLHKEERQTLIGGTEILLLGDIARSRVGRHSPVEDVQPAGGMCPRSRKARRKSAVPLGHAGSQSPPHGRRKDRPGFFRAFPCTGVGGKVAREHDDGMAEKTRGRRGSRYGRRGTAGGQRLDGAPRTGRRPPRAAERIWRGGSSQAGGLTERPAGGLRGGRATCSCPTPRSSRGGGPAGSPPPPPTRAHRLRWIAGAYAGPAHRNPRGGRRDASSSSQPSRMALMARPWRYGRRPRAGDRRGRETRAAGPSWARTP